ncbi:MAG: cupin domain-containing protein [Candidatus Dormibacteraeota bacterium]|nr:cupin domain-containing protein [Candidatus Dormibacteraeota bacterium]
MTGNTAALIIETESLRPKGGGAPLFEGYRWGGAAVSFFVSDAAPGRGVSLHRHPYDEVFLLLEGEARFWVEGRSLEAHAGQILVAPAGSAHKFINSGSGRLRSVNIHSNDRNVVEWLPESDT